MSTSTNASEQSVVYSLGFCTTTLPIRRDGAICQVAMISGQFH